MSFGVGSNDVDKSIVLFEGVKKNTARYTERIDSICSPVL
ncbi:hypothetical protein LEP1GSC040_2251 [Leptospira santarosai str. 2000030832]|nr:hypothetical protein LEP1GSC040_2251 [Leptospira santarosai str. 2000030832]